jgi:glycerol-3-phosphate dehydrogenase
LAVNLAQTIFDLGGFAVNYTPVVSLIKEEELIAGAVIRDLERGSEYQVRARAVINATGVFSDNIRKMDEPDAKTVVAASQGSHVVLPKAFLPGNTAIMVPNTPDGRVLFAVPWHDHVVVGTTDIGVDNITLEPIPMDEEIGFILTNAAKYLSKAPNRSDVLSVYAGLRPLVKVGDAKSTATLSRDHTILISNAGLLTIAGGKWTTYRKMAEDAVEQAQTMAGFEERPCKTDHLQIHGWTRQAIPEASLRVYGADAPAIREIARQEPDLAEKIHPELPYIGAEVVWAVRAEMARTVEDVLARRTRALLLGARASIEAAPRVAELMARELKRDGDWQKQTVRSFDQVAQGYVL